MRRAALAILLLCCAHSAFAHQTSIKYVDIAVADRTATIRFTVAPSDVVIPLALAPDAQPDVQVAAASPAVAPFVARWLALPRCAPTPADAAPDPDGRFLVITWRATCAEPIERALTLDFSAFFALDGKHQAIVTVHRDDAAGGEPAIVRAAQPIVTLELGARPSTLAWIRYGMDHIYSGRDHICFVLALLLVVMLERREAAAWATRAPLATLKHTTKIITAFTVAHSISLILASLGVIRLPSVFVESAIAVSIAYTALEDIVHPDVRWRFVLTFAFGLIHGLGFASALQELLPPDHVIVPLLAFNVGVELGQLTIVLVALPLLWLAARELTATRYRRTVMPALASIIFVLGLIWLVERLSGLTILGM